MGSCFLAIEGLEIFKDVDEHVYTNVLDIGRRHLRYIAQRNWKIMYERRMNFS